MIVVRSFRFQNSFMTMLCIMPEVESTLIWNNSAWNPPQYFVENNWVVCLLSCISQSGSPFTLTCVLTTPKRNCLNQLLMNTLCMSHCIGSSLKILYIYSQSETFDLLTSFSLETSHAHESVDLKNRQNCLEGNFFLPLFPCYILTVYTNGLDECVGRLQCRL